MSGNATPSKITQRGGGGRKQARHMTAQRSNFMSAHKLKLMCAMELRKGVQYHYLTVTGTLSTH